MKIVLDSNIIVSAFGVQGLCSEIFAYCLSEHEIITSHYIIREVIQSLEEDFGMQKNKIREHKKFLIEETKATNPLPVSCPACRDSKDLMILGTAWAGKSDIIITGDKDLLVLKEFKGTIILGVREFWEKRRNYL